jgi:hypothetical protein
LADRLDLIAKKLQPIGTVGIRREDVDNTAAPTKIAGQFNGVIGVKTVPDQPRSQLIRFELGPDSQSFSALFQLGLIWHRLHQRLNGGY